MNFKKKYPVRLLAVTLSVLTLLQTLPPMPLAAAIGQEDDFYFEVAGSLLPEEIPSESDVSGGDISGGDISGGDFGGCARRPEEPTDHSKHLNAEINVYIGGKPYTPGTDVTVTDGAKFSYDFKWNIKGQADGHIIEEDDYLEYRLFKIPNLTGLRTFNDASLYINGLLAGKWSLTYNNGGELWFRVTFNEDAHMIDLKSISGYFGGSGSFSASGGGSGNIIVGDAESEAHITIDKQPERPPQPERPADGVAWKPSLPPVWNGTLYGTGKGLKFYNGKDQSLPPWVEWRGVYLTKLQEFQAEFVKDPTNYKLTEVEGTCVVQDTLDRNQRFMPISGDAKYNSEAPFYFELPIIVPGTGNFLNGGIGSAAYDGNGDFGTYIRGHHFTGVTLGDADGPGGDVMLSAEDAKERMLDEAPLTWTVTTDPETYQQTLTINLGKLGTTEPGKGMTLGLAESKNNWSGSQVKDRINDLIKVCDTNLTNLDAGYASPLNMLVDQKLSALKNSFDVALARLPAGEQEKWSDHWTVFYGAVDTKIKDLDTNHSFETANDAKLSPEGEDAFAALAKLPVGMGTLGAQASYGNFKRGYESLFEDQSTYLRDWDTYRTLWTDAKENYQRTRDFYAEGRVYGFVMKYSCVVQNTSVKTLHNRLTITQAQERFDADDDANVMFNFGVTGDYQSGSAVLQKADGVFDTGEAGTSIKDVEEAKAGLNGAKFRIYCGTADGGHKPGADTMCWFSPAFDGSWYFQHNGKNIQDGHKEDKHESVLEVDENGKLIMVNLDLKHDHYLVEETPPVGYYAEQPDTYVRIPRGNGQSVQLMLVPNLARAVRLQKVSAYNGHPIEGATFELYKTDGGNGDEPITGFKQTIWKGRTFYRYTPPTEGTTQATIPLVTDGNGMLYIHGLPAGSYYLKEIKPAPGYQTALPAVQYPFELKDKRPTALEGGGYEGLTEDGGFYYVLAGEWDEHGAVTGVVRNQPNTADLTLTKVGTGSDANGLAGAKFVLAHWTGTEQEWTAWDEKSMTKPGGEHWFEMVKPQTEYDDKWFYTTNETEEELTPPASFGDVGGLTADGIITSDEGRLVLKNIPRGHYILIEAEAPTGYKLPYEFWHFQVTGNAEDDKVVSLYTDKECSEGHLVEDNKLQNLKHGAQFALIKYDPEDFTDGQKQPTPNGTLEKYNPGDDWSADEDGWKWQSAATDGTLYEGKGLPGAVYKLFFRKGEGVNYDSRELESTDGFAAPVSISGDFDPCIALGTTDDHGVLRLESMTPNSYPQEGADGSENTLDLKDGLNIGPYYLVEVKAPEKYQRDTTAIPLQLDESTMVSGSPSDGYIPGLIKTAPNRKAQYGLRVIKTDGGYPDELDSEFSRFPPLSDVEFELTLDKEGMKTLSIEDMDNGIYRLDGVKKARNGGLLSALAGLFRGDTKEAAATILKPDENGVLTILGVEYGTTYYLWETRAPQGYKKLEEPVELRVGENTTEAELGGETYQLVERVVENERLMGKASLVKLDGEDKETSLQGAVFGLFWERNWTLDEDDPEYIGENDPGYSEFVNDRTEVTKIGEAETDENGRLTFEDLRWLEEGDYYYIQELKAPEGYALSSLPYYLEMDRDWFTPEGEPIEPVFRSFNVKGEMGRLEVLKVDAEDRTTPLEGVMFVLWVKNLDTGEYDYLNPYAMYKTDAEGKFSAELPPGTYKIVEMLPKDGYLYPEDWVDFFEKGSEFEIKAGHTTQQSIEYKFYNQQGEGGVLLRKIDDQDGKPLQGAAFSFYQGESDTPMGFTKLKNGVWRYDAAGEHTVLQTDAAGELRLTFPEEFTTPLDEVELDREKQIYYMEIQAPAGYDRLEGRHPVQSFWTNQGVTGYEGYVIHLLWNKTEVKNHRRDDLSQPSQPGKPDKPGIPNKPDIPDKPNIPQTGSNWGFVAVLLAAGGLLLFLGRKTRYADKHIAKKHVGNSMPERSGRE